MGAKSGICSAKIGEESRVERENDITEVKMCVCSVKIGEESRAECKNDTMGVKSDRL